MWFTDEMIPVYDNGIRQDICDAGFEPMLIRNKEHINKIDDEIIAEIRRSAFMVTDFASPAKLLPSEDPLPSELRALLAALFIGDIRIWAHEIEGDWGRRLKRLGWMLIASSGFMVRLEAHAISDGHRRYLRRPVRRLLRNKPHYPTQFLVRYPIPCLITEGSECVHSARVPIEHGLRNEHRSLHRKGKIWTDNGRCRRPALST